MRMGRARTVIDDGGGPNNPPSAYLTRCPIVVSARQFATEAAIRLDISSNRTRSGSGFPMLSRPSRNPTVSRSSIVAHSIPVGARAAQPTAKHASASAATQGQLCRFDRR